MNKFYESIEKILETGKAGKLGALSGKESCVYTDGGGKFCAIGALMSPGLLRDLRAEGRLEDSVGELFWDSLFDPEEYGFSVKQATAIQAWHDRAFDKSSQEYTPNDFLEILEGVLGREILRIADRPLEGYEERISMLPENED